MLKQRVITALIIVAGLLAALVFLSAVQLSLVFALLVSVAAWEWADMSGIGSAAGRASFLAVCVSLMGAVAWQGGLLGDVNEALIRELLTAACVWWAIALLWVKSYPASAPLWGTVTMRVFMGFLVLVPAWLAISYLRFLSDGILLILLLIALVASADIGAYFFGRAFGKAKLAPAVSPGKSWAGFWGGLFSSTCLMATLWYFWPGGMSVALLPMMCLAAVTVLASVLGDLLESMVKRHRGIKDSGKLLPGHGGFMDRLDSLTAAAPVFTLGMMSVGWQ